MGREWRDVGAGYVRDDRTDQLGVMKLRSGRVEVVPLYCTHGECVRAATDRVGDRQWCKEHVPCS